MRILPKHLLTLVCFLVWHVNPCADAIEEPVESPEQQDIQTVITSLSLAHHAQERLVDMDPRSLEKSSGFQKTVASSHITKIHLAVGDLLKAGDQIHSLDSHRETGSDAVRKSALNLRNIYKGLITNYFDLILLYYRKFPLEGLRANAVSKKDHGASLPWGTTEAGKSTGDQAGKGRGTRQTMRSMEQVEGMIKEGWDLIPPSCITVGYSLIHPIPRSRSACLIFTRQERDAVLSYIDHLFPDLTKGAISDRSSAKEGVRMISNVLREVPATGETTSPPQPALVCHLLGIYR